ncbi:MAG TPA: IS1595 family transposase [Actinomycetes bacterium]|nr:IS1595 family transposase [Actinomycetes bacterium]
MDPPAAQDRPEAGRDYPADWPQFLAWFPDEAACVRYLEALSWPHGFVCPGCGAAGPPWRGSRRRLVCRACGHQTTVTAGTLFQGTRTPLRQWFAACWHVATAEQGVSARRLARELGLGSYETAWTMLHRLRRAMVRSGRPRLEGVAEVGSVVLLGRPAARGGPSAALAAIAVEDRGEKAGRVRMQRLRSRAVAQLVGFVTRAVEPGATIRADRASVVDALAGLGYGRAPDTGLVHLPGVRDRLEAWLLGTHQGAASHDQLDWYLDEFTFRFNRRASTHRGLLFYRLLEEAVVTPPLPYRRVVHSGIDPGPEGAAPRREAGRP